MKRITILKLNLMRAAMTLALIMTCATAWADNDPVSYIDADGTTKTCTNYTVLHTGDNVSYLPGGWYVVSEDAVFSSQMTFSGSAFIILCDGKTMTITVDDNDLDNAILCMSEGNLFFYGQSGQTGKLMATTTNPQAAINASGASPYGNITINGGIINASGNDGLCAFGGNVIINGGKVTANGTTNGIKSWCGNIILGWTRTTDYIHASSYKVQAEGKTVSVATGQAFLTDDATPQQVSGTISNLNLINGKTLTPDVSSGFTVSTDGNTYTIWNAAGWDVFCDMLEDGANNGFIDKTVKLVADIGTTASPITRMAGSEGHKFKGAFDGQGHTLTVNYSGSDLYIAPFRVVSDYATFRDLTVAGTINSSAANAGGLIGELYGEITVEHCTSNVDITSTGGQVGGFIGLCKYKVTFNDCVSSAVIHSSGEQNGGFVGYSWSQGEGTHAMSFSGCVFNGKLLQINGYGEQNGGFIGRKGESQIVTITNCLVDPAALAAGETMANGSSATFSRDWDGNATIPNSYYITPFGEPQGKQAHSITAGQYVTVANAGTATAYATSGITTYGTGIQYNNVLYAGEGDNVSLTLGNTPPQGSLFTGYTTSGGTLTGEGNPYTLTMPNADVTLTATLVWAQSATYLNADGTIGSHDAFAINSSYMPTTLGSENTETWYVVTESVTYNNIPQSIALWGDVKLILGEGCTMTVNTVGTYGIDGYQGSDHNGGKGSLTIYGQELNTGTLEVGAAYSAIAARYGYTQHSGNVTLDCYDACVFTKSTINIYGGQVTAVGLWGLKGEGITISGGQVNAICNYIGTVPGGGNASNPWGYGGIVSSYGDITISGGQVTAHGNSGYGIYCEYDNIILGWTYASDHIYASDYKVANDHTVSIAEGQVLFTDDATPVAVSGTISDLSLINGKTLRPDYSAHFKQTAENEYTIYTAEGWNCFCDFISQGEDFSNDTVKLGASIEVNRMAGSENKPFKGVFKGHNHVLTVNYSGNDDYVAPFRVIHGNVEFWNLEVRGTINSTGNYAAGLVGHLHDTVYIYGCTSDVDITCAGGAGGFVGLCDEDYLDITDCLSSAVIHSAGGNNGGFIGYSHSTDTRISFMGCVFNGKLLQHNGSGGSNGGFLGWKGDDKIVKFWDCLYDPAPLSDGETYASSGSATFSREHADYAATITNSYYTTAFGTPQGNQARTITAGEYVTIDIEYVGDYPHCNLLALMSGNGIKYNNVIYSSNGKQVDHLCLSNTPPTGCTFNSYTVSPEGASLTYNSGYYYMLMPDADVTINATFNYALEIEGYGDSNGGWAFIASPVSGSIKPDEVQNLIANPATDFDLYRFNQSADLEWENYHHHSDDFNLINGQGYLYATKENRTLVFSGEYNTAETETVNLVYDANADLPGWNLVGNPFTTNAYVNKPYYRMNAEGSDIVPVARYWIHDLPACTGAMVQADAENETATFSKTAPEPRAMGEGCLLITLTRTDADNNVEHDRVIVNFNEGIELGKFVFNEEHTKICIPKSDKDYAIAYAEKTSEIPLNFKAASEGQYTLSVIPEAVETTYLHLIDNLTSADIDLLATPVYNFSATASDYTSRFRLVFRANSVSENEDKVHASFAFISNGEIVITGLDGDACNASLQVIDVLGHVCRDAMLASPNQRISTTGMPAGLYVLRLIDGETVRTQKIVID